MDHATSKDLLGELLDLHNSKSPFLDEKWERPRLDRYTSTEVFERERERIFSQKPQIAAHCSQLQAPGDFLRVEIDRKPLLLMRGDDGVARAFFNVCRHRGAQLVGDDSGCKQRFSCPYHAWTWNNTGDLIAVPHEKTGFPGLDRSEFGLSPVACTEFAGWIWVSLAPGEIDVEKHLGPLADDLVAMQAQDYQIFDTTDREIKANWKILVEGGIESYHFRVAHRNTIAPLFLDNLSSYRMFDGHVRSVLPRSTLPELNEQPADDWEILKHANVLYSLFPAPQFLVQEDHFVWIQATPVAPDLTVSRLSTVIPRRDNTPERQAYWQRNHELTIRTLDEDFTLGESIQKGLQTGANTHLNFGRFEGALAAFNQYVDQVID